MPDTPIGTNSPDYTLVTADLGADIYCKVTATNASGTANADSNTVGPVAAAPSTFTPADLPGLLFWYEARNGGVTTSGGNVTGVPNLAATGSGYNLTPAGTVPFNATGFNGTPAFAFNAGAGAVLRTGATSVAMTAVSTGSFVAVGQMTTTTIGEGRLLSYVASGDGEDYANSTSCSIMARAGTTDIVQTYRGSGTLSIDTPISLATDYRFGVVFNGTNAIGYLNNVAGTPTACSLSWGATGQIGIGNMANLGADISWAGPVAMIFGGNQVWDSTMMTSLDNWIKTQLGLS